VIPRTHRHLAKRAFATAAPSFWNSLPDNVRDNQRYSNFLSKLKTHCFNIAFYNHNIRYLYYLTYILLCTAPLSYGLGGTLANPDDMI